MIVAIIGNPNLNMTKTLYILLPVNISYFFDKYNIVKIDIDILKNIMKENLKEGISNHGVIGSHFINDFRISYFDNKILCIEEYADYFGGRAHGEI